MPPSLIDLNFNVLATIAMIRQREEYSPQSPEPSHTSLISTPPMNLSTIEDWETPHTTIIHNTFYSEGEPKRVFWKYSSNEIFDSNEPSQVSFASSSFCTPPTPPRQNRKLSMGISFPQKKGGMSQHTCEARSQPLPAKKTPYCSGKNSNLNTFNQTPN